MRSIIQKISDSVTEATGLQFHYDTPQTLNITLDRAKFPCAMLHIVSSGTLADTNGILHERLTVDVLFATRSSLDFDGLTVENDELQAMKERAFTWIASLFRSRDLRLVSMNGTSRYYPTDDALFSAYGVNVTLEELQGYSKCNLSI